MNDFVSFLLTIPGFSWAWGGLVEWWHLPPPQLFTRAGEVVLQVFGGFEFVRLIDRRVFKRRSRLEEERELLEHRVSELDLAMAGLRNAQKQLNADLNIARGKLPEAAISRAERELSDLNPEAAVRHLEQWFEDNAESIAKIAKHLARHHIVYSVPDPADHLERARNMLRLARSASPLDQEVHEISREFDLVNADLQAQILRDGDTQVVWNSAMMGRASLQGDRLVPVIMTLRDIADWLFRKGLWRLTPLFADRAAELAWEVGSQHRRMWCQQESQAAFYQLALGRPGDALRRVDRLLAYARDFLTGRDTEVIDAQFVRAWALSNLGRSREALAEIEAFAPIQAAVKGEHHPDTLTTRYLRAKVLRDLGRNREALAEIEAFAPIQSQVIGERHPDTLNIRYLRAQVLSNLGRNEEALREIEALAPITAEVKGEHHPDTLTTRYLRAHVLSRLGRNEEALAEIEAFAPIQAEVKGEHHPHTLTTRYLRALVLSNLERNEEALAEIEAFAPIEAEVKGEPHPDTLSTRYLRAKVLSNLERNEEALAEIEAFAPIQAAVKGEHHPDTLTTRYLRALVVSNLGRNEEALAEIEAFAPIEAEVKGEHHPDTLTTRYLRAQVLSNLGRNPEEPPPAP